MLAHVDFGVLDVLVLLVGDQAQRTGAEALVFPPFTLLCPMDVPFEGLPDFAQVQYESGEYGVA